MIFCVWQEETVGSAMFRHIRMSLHFLSMVFKTSKISKFSKKKQNGQNPIYCAIRFFCVQIFTRYIIISLIFVQCSTFQILSSLLYVSIDDLVTRLEFVAQTLLCREDSFFYVFHLKCCFIRVVHSFPRIDLPNRVHAPKPNSSSPRTSPSASGRGMGPIRSEKKCEQHD